MPLDKVSLNRLRKRLPTKFMEPTLELMKGRGRDVGKPYISDNLNGKKFDQDAIECLIEVAEKHQAGLATLKARARGDHQHA